jgi:sugar lactone lactonase YvrE
MPRVAKPAWAFSLTAALAGGAIAALAQDGLFVSTRLTPKGEYTFQIEGPAVDAAGNLYVGNLAIKDDPKNADKNGGAIGQVNAGEKTSSLFAILPVSKVGTKLIKSKTSGIRFDRAGHMYATDFNNHNIFVFAPGQSIPQVYFHADDFHQPNDLAIASDGTLYASDPLRPKGVPASGRIWRITRGADGKGQGAIMSGPAMGATNGIDLSPDETTLYVGEADSNKIRAFRIDGATLTGGATIAAFPAPKSFDLDGLRTDATGRIFVTQNGAGKIVILKPDGSQAHPPVTTTGKNPSNLTFGGPDGKTVFVTQADGGFIESFRVDQPGREFCKPFSETAC